MPSTKVLTPEEKQAIELAAKKAAEEAAALRAVTVEKTKELIDNINSTAGKFDSDYYGFIIENFSPDDLKTLPLVGTSGNITQNLKGDVSKYGIVMTPSCGPFSECDYYKTSLEEDVWNTPGGISVTFDNMPARIREFIKQKRDEKVNILAVKLAEMDGYGKKKRSTSNLIDEYNERKANASAGNIRINCSSYDKTRKTFVYLGNLELIAMEVYELKVPKTKHSMDVPVFYLVA